MEQRLTIITLGVSDINVASDFYENKLGWKRHGSSMGDIVFFMLNGIQLAIYPRIELAKDATVPAKGEGFKGFTLAHNVRSEKEVDELIATLKAKGVKVVKEPQKAEWGGYSSYISDPEGNLWEIAFNPYMKLDKSGNVVG
ncbi:MAG TPA: VOC family protein [Bacteroidia bacterium]|jgi:catechol 2,3-dioxygenase-like lactoylglutathione lyase family enzyme|nr:VOC family protein [Bacteroidia bacterium]